jgi:dUTP pyrophosphatase
VNIKRFRKDAPLPERKTDGSVGYDLCSCVDYHRDWAGTAMVDPFTGDMRRPNHEGTILIPLGWGFEIPPGHVGILAPRSSTNHWLLTGYIDPDYRGEVFAKTTSNLLLNARPTFKAGERIAQLIIVPVVTPMLVEVDSLSETARGAGGNGSTGR